MTRNFATSIDTAHYPQTKQFCAKVRAEVDKEVALRQNFNDPEPDVGKKGRGL